MDGAAASVAPAGRTVPWRAVLPWLLGLLVAGAAAWQVLDSIAERRLRRDAEQTALTYAFDLARQTPGIDAIVAGAAPSAEAMSELQRFRRVGKVFRYKLFDTQGRLLLDSDQPHCVGPACRASDLPPAASATEVRGVAAVRQARVHLRHAGPGSALPRVFSEAYVPLTAPGGATAVIEVYVDQTARSERVREAFLEVVALVLGLVGIFGAALATMVAVRMRERTQTEHRLRELAEHDALTGALNRHSFDAALAAAAQRHDKGGHGFSVLYVDIDHFKQINDSYGHAAGDAVLRETARRLTASLRGGDLVARLGGDEFAVLLQPTRQPETVESLRALAERLLESLAQPVELRGQRLLCSASIGVARRGVDAGSTAELLRRADAALFRAKAAGRRCLSFYDAAVDAEIECRRLLEADLTKAVHEQALSLNYQPLFHADGVTLLGYEALMRWQHPTRGAVPPAEFIPLAERAGLIDELGAWALRRACADAVAWPSSLKVAVNVSSAQFGAARDLADVVFGALDTTGLAAQRLELELTESLLIEDSPAIRATLARLTQRGVKLALDDFGTGYSSLSYLWQYPLSKVKLDRSFTKALGSPRVAVVVRAAIAMAHSLGLRVTGEVVETPAQMEALRRLGCDELQGFLLGRPAPNAAWDHWQAPRETDTTQDLEPTSADALQTLPAPL